MMLLCLGPGLASAQDATRPVLTVPWTATPGLSFLSESGEVSSFSADLLRLVAQDAGFDLRFVRYDTPAAVLGAVAQGDTDLSLLAAMPMLETQNLTLSAVSDVELMLYLRRDAPADITIDTISQGRIGVLRGTISNRLSLPEAVEIVPFDDEAIAFTSLLTKELDGVIILHSFAEPLLRTTGLDNLVRASFPAVRTGELHAILNKRHAGLAPRIDAAIAALRASGAVDALRLRWFLVPAAPMLDVLTVGVSPFPPYQVIGPDGRASGFAVELLRALAERADLTLRFTEVSRDSWARGPRAGVFDMVPARSINPVEAKFLHFSLPVQTIEYATFVPAGGLLGASGGRIGVLSASPIRAEIEAALNRPLVPVSSAAAGAEALLDGTLDALVFPRLSFGQYLQEIAAQERITRLDSPLFSAELAVALRPDLGEIRRRLDVVIPGFLGSAQYRALARDWLEPTPFWTQDRVRLLLLLAGAAIAAGGALFVAQILRAARRAERLRRETAAARDRLSAILEGTRHAIIGFAKGGHIAVTNPGARALLHLPDGAEPRPWPADAQFLDPITGTELPPDSNPAHRVVNGAATDGPLYLFRASTADPPRYVRVTSDQLSARRTGLTALMIVEDDNDNELNRRKLDRSQRLSSLGLLAGGIAHDFNNILAAIQYRAELARLTASDALAETFTGILDSVERGSDLTRRLLGFSRQSPQAPGAINLASCFSALRELSRPVAGAGVTLDIPDPDPDLFVWCDGGELENALLNLVINARDAILGASGKGRISLHLRCYDWSDDGAPPRAMIEIAVSDTGPGMPESVRRRAADPFFSTKRDIGGTGLGLAMVESFAQRADGHLAIYSEPGHGTTVRLRLPRATGDAPLAIAPADPAPEPGNGAHILLVDDQEDLRRCISGSLTQLGYTLEAAPTAVAAITMLETGTHFDLVLSDIVMPGGLSGIDLAHHLRTHHPGTAIVLMTGFANVETVHLDGVQVLQKPFPLSHLAQAIRDALDTPGG
ncbi:transporter substrate-binding domain-containing protein [Salipiger sp. 1_MG-2023]|uniref:transporter substrate-binding domain-containing protein n=1 Tax=Salipiger sp. 1_MG-2023 TaxID=3062665 RepID=UPI0026E1E363|nr:transporter substrate-binding domain-containing protein [Salipiger sp. 1_MG-2023]MDO6586754.1 transporter substrate-binding domain-containing protein [Salipiger sp. 1_MG-2023]